MPIIGLSRWPVWRRWFGGRAERAAAKFLHRLGYRILARNVQLPPGELDMVALDGRTLVFVEVRSTECAEVLRPAASVDAAKQKKLSDLALAYLQKHRLLGHNARFDVLAVSWPGDQRDPRIVHYPDAFPSVGRFQMFS
jgi:putative endonuclease